jgi:glutamyl-tRNA synthetase
MNGVYTRRSEFSKEDLEDLIVEIIKPNLPPGVEPPSREYFMQVWPLIMERVKNFKEIVEVFIYFFEDKVDHKANLDKYLKKEVSIKALESVLKSLTELSNWDGEDRDQERLTEDAKLLEEVLRGLASELGLKTGDFFGLLRVATTGRTAAPPLFQTMAVLGKERCLDRIRKALDRLKTAS